MVFSSAPRPLQLMPHRGATRVFKKVFTGKQVTHDCEKGNFFGIFVDLCDYSTNSPGWRSAATQGKFFLPSKSPSKVSLIDLMVIVWREVPMVSLSQESEVNTLPALVGGLGIYQSFFLASGVSFIPSFTEAYTNLMITPHKEILLAYHVPVSMTMRLALDFSSD